MTNKLSSIVQYMLILLIIYVGIVTDAYAIDLPFHGFAEYSSGSRAVNDPNKEDDILLNEARFQMEIAASSDMAEFTFKSDFIYDDIKDKAEIEIREGYIMIFPSDAIEIKAGRQILTWGTGEYVFINDLFPKDWQSFFSGRDDEYLKVPSNTIKISLFTEFFNIDITCTPVFTPDTFVSGERLSYFNSLTNKKTGSELRVSEPDKKVRNSEWAIRLNRNIKGIETAIYGYKGFYKRPLGYRPSLQRNIFPELAVYGASIRGQVFKGIGNIEAGYYDSIDDRHGDDPFIENSSFNGLAGYSQELFQDFNIGVQYYMEYMLDYDNYKAAYTADPSTSKDEVRHLVTVSLSRLLLMQTLRLSLFTFYSPSDADLYIRPSVSYKWTDQISLVLGGNIFRGDNEHTFFGQLEDNTNIYARIQYGF